MGMNCCPQNIDKGYLHDGIKAEKDLPTAGCMTSNIKIMSRQMVCPFISFDNKQELSSDSVLGLIVVRMVSNFRMKMTSSRLS